VLLKNLHCVWYRFFSGAKIVFYVDYTALLSYLYLLKTKQKIIAKYSSTYLKIVMSDIMHNIKNITKLLVILVFSFPIIGNALEYYANENMPNTLLLEGTFTPADVEIFKMYVKEHKIKTIIFNSAGGNLRAGINIGIHMREKGLTSELHKGFVCYSACSYAFMGGIVRKIAQDAEYGMHRPYFPEEIEIAGSYRNGYNTGVFTSVIIVSYLVEMGLDPLTASTHLLSTDIILFDVSQQTELNISTK